MRDALFLPCTRKANAQIKKIHDKASRRSAIRRRMAQCLSKAIENYMNDGVIDRKYYELTAPYTPCYTYNLSVRLLRRKYATIDVLRSRFGIKWSFYLC